jgi:hypothetical protein
MLNLPSKIKARIMMMAVTQNAENLHNYFKNLKSHVRSVKLLGRGINKLNKFIKKLDKKFEENPQIN